MVVELAAVVCLECEDLQIEVCTGNVVEALNGCEGIRFVSERESPGEMAVIVEKQQVISRI